VVLRIEGLLHEGLLEPVHLVAALDQQRVLRLLHLVLIVVGMPRLAEASQTGWKMFTSGAVRRDTGVVGVPGFHFCLLSHLGLSETDLRNIGLDLLFRLLLDNAGLMNEGLCCYLFPRRATRACRRAKPRKTAEIHALTHANTLLQLLFLNGSMRLFLFLEIRGIGD
jgi:hypothetical protein